MDLKEAQRIIEEFDAITTPTHEERADYAEAMNYLYDVTGDSNFLVGLGMMYETQQMSDFAFRYYELAAAKGNQYAPLKIAEMGRIKAKEGDKKEALRLLDLAREYLARRIADDPVCEDLRNMKWLVANTYLLRAFDPDQMELYDLFYVLAAPAKVRFSCRGKSRLIESWRNGDVMSVRFDGTSYLSVDDFFELAQIEGKLLTALRPELTGFTIL